MKRIAALLALLIFSSLGIVMAQDAADPTTTPSFGPIDASNVTPTEADVTESAPDSDAVTATLTDTGNTIELDLGSETELEPTVDAGTSTLGAADPRLATCNAYSLPGFRPYAIRPGDTLGNLLIGSDNITVTQLAALNCLDDPTALPVGATIWIPGQSTVLTEADPTIQVTSTPFQSVGNASISSLRISADPAPNLEGATVTWDAVGTSAYFYSCPVATGEDSPAECVRPADLLALPAQYSLTLQDFVYAGPYRYRLEVMGTDSTATQDLTFNVMCSQDWMAPITGSTGCPDSPALVVYGVWQPFEGGVMVYFSDTSEIYVMTNNDHSVQVFPDTFEEGMLEVEYDDLPEGRFPARRGFGIVWEGLGGPDSPLGLGLAQEIGYDSARQAVGRVSYTTFIQGPGETVYAVTLIPGAGIGYWTQVAG